MSFERREYSGNAPATTLSGDITSAATSLTLADGTGYPTGATGPFFITVDRGKSSEEKIKCLSRSGNSITVVTSPSSGRGADGSAPASHTSGAAVEHTITKTDLDEANQHYSDTALDHHTQYLNTTRHDVNARHTFGAAFPTPAAPSTSYPGDAASAGSAGGPARADHVHGREASSYAEVTANQGGITTLTDLTGLSVTFTAIAGHRYKVTAYVYNIENTNAAVATSLLLREGSTVLQRCQQTTPGANYGLAYTLSRRIAPSAGAHTYKLSVDVSGGTATAHAGSDSPAFILVEDLGI